MFLLRRLSTLKRLPSTVLQQRSRPLCSHRGDDGDSKNRDNNNKANGSEIEASDDKNKPSSARDNKNELVTSQEQEKRVRIIPTELSVHDYKPLKDTLKFEYNALRLGVDADDLIVVPRETDVAIIGGGAIGLATAYFMMLNSDDEMNVTVIERDPSYKNCSSVLSVGGIRQQFSLKENIQMSMFSSEFIRNIKENLGVLDDDPPDIQFHPQGYLFLASEQGKEIMMTNHRTQLECGAKVMLLTPPELKERFPWLNVDGIAMGSLGLENEGWFDPWMFLGALKAKCINMGVKFVHGDVVDFSMIDGRPMPTWDGKMRKREMLEQVMIRTEDKKVYPLKFALCVNAAGAWSGKIAELAGIGTDNQGPLSVPLPVQPRKRYVFMVHCPDGPGLDTPLMIDNSGVYFRREGLGGHYICGVSPRDSSDGQPGDDIEDTDEVFHKHVLPALEHRIPILQGCTVKSAWAGYYDYNYFDENLIIGNHPMHRNFFFATGCSGHGIQQSLAIGRGTSEMLLKDDFTSIDLTRFKFDRIMDGNPIYETNCV